MADINKNDLVGKRLTWGEIKKYFPHQWVGLTEVVTKDGNTASIASAVLKYVDKSKSELVSLALDGDCVARYTTVDEYPPEVGLIE